VALDGMGSPWLTDLAYDNPSPWRPVTRGSWDGSPGPHPLPHGAAGILGVGGVPAGSGGGSVPWRVIFDPCLQI
jgi:hypothetical protein